MAKKKSNAGRKCTITPEIERLLIEMFRIDATDTQACLNAGCSETAYYRKLKADEKFRQRMHAAQNFLHLRAKENVARRITDAGDVDKSQWLLERREKDRYSTRTEQKTEVEAAVTYAELEGKAKTPEEARRLAEEQEIDDEE